MQTGDKMRRIITYITIAATVGLFVGCATIDDPAKVRQEHIDSFRAELKGREKERLASPLTLNDCINIALHENYEVKQAVINEQLALTNKDMSFANFLPYVDMTAKLTTWSHQPMAFGSFTQDKTVRTVDIGGAMPILMPSVWMMYANSKLGMSVSELSKHYVCQSVILDTSIAFFKCLNAEDNIATLETQVSAAESQAKRIGGMAKEGLIAPWQGEQAEYQHKARVTELARARRNLTTCKATLLQSMGLSPELDITLDHAEVEIEVPEVTLEQLVLLALEKNPALSIQDHKIVMQENAVRSAITDFLPTLSAFANFNFTSDSIAAYNKNIYGGFSVAWNLFKGFANMANYKAAKLRKMSAELERESVFISVMLEVIKAEASLKDALESYSLAEAAYSSAKAKFVEYESKQKEGLVTVNDMLDAQADMDKAQAVLSLMKYQRHLAAATLQMTLGTIGSEFLENKEN